MYNNERLEFLGDAVLELMVSDYIYNRFQSLPEGDLTKLRANIVCEPSLVVFASKLHQAWPGPRRNRNRRRQRMH